MDSDSATPKEPTPGGHPRPEEQPPAPSEGSVPRTRPGDAKARDDGEAKTRGGRALARLLATVEWLGNLLPHPVTLFALFALGVVVLSGITAAAGLAVADPRPGHEGEVFAVRSLMTGAGVRWMAQRLVTNFTGFVPLGTVLVALLGVGVADKSGLLSAVVRTGERFGQAHVIDVLLGNETPQIASWGHERLPTFGVGAHLDKRVWRSVVRQLVAAGLLTVDVDRYGALRLGQDAIRLMRGEMSIELNRLEEAEAAYRTAARANANDWRGLFNLCLLPSRRGFGCG